MPKLHAIWPVSYALHEARIDYLPDSFRLGEDRIGNVRQDIYVDVCLIAAGRTSARILRFISSGQRGRKF